jgi:pimeloyl-ACP methyl ester carboxylesterase
MITKTLDIEGPVRVIDHGGEGPLILLLHGLAGSADNWAAVGAGLARSGRVIAVDLLGCGDTPPAGRAVTVEHNAALVARIISELGEDSATLIGHSMGGLVAMIAAAEYPWRVDRLVLVSPALPLNLRQPPNVEVLTKLLGPLVPIAGPLSVHLYRAGRTPRQEVDETLRMNCFDIDTIPVDTREMIIEGAARRRSKRWAVGAFVDADRSIAGYVLRPSRLRRLVHRVSQPVLLVHGIEDRLVSTKSAKWVTRQRPDWDFIQLNGIGHVPMLETPEAFTYLVRDWLDRE